MKIKTANYISRYNDNLQVRVESALETSYVLYTPHKVVNFNYNFRIMNLPLSITCFKESFAIIFYNSMYNSTM
jgi:hypothetical protein